MKMKLEKKKHQLRTALLNFPQVSALSGNEQNVRSSRSRKEPLPRQPHFSTTLSQATNEKDGGVRACGKSIKREKNSTHAGRFVQRLICNALM